MPFSLPAQTTSQIPKDLGGATYDTYLGVADSAPSGTIDPIQVVFYEVESSVTAPFYIAVDSPGSGDAIDANNAAGPESYFDVLGGPGALSDPVARQLVYGSRAEATSNADLLASRTFTTESGWNYLGPFLPPQGELLGNKYYFRVVMSINADVNRNAFRYDISFSTNPSGGVPPGSDQFRAFAYGWSIAFLGDSNGDAAGGTPRVYELFPFVAEGINAQTYDNLVASNVDLDDGQGAGDAQVIITAQKQAYDEGGGGLDGVNQPVTTAGASGVTNNTTFNGITANQDGGTWRVTYTDSNGKAGFVSNPADLWHWLTDTIPGANDVYTAQDRDELLRTYSEFYEPVDPDSVALQVDDGVALTTATEQITLQVVDAAGNPVPFIEKVWVGVSGDGRIASINGDTTGLPAAGAYVTTDSGGLAVIEVSDSTPLTEDLGVTVTVTANGSAAPGGDGDESVLPGSPTSTTVDFLLDPDPEISSTANSTGSENTTFGISAVRVWDVDGGSLNTTDDIRIILPSSLISLGATFNPGATETTGIDDTQGGGTTGTVGAVSYEAGNTIALVPVTFDFSADDRVTIGGLEIVAPANVSGSGSLQLSFDGDQIGDVADDKIVTINDGTTTFTWDGDTSTSWINGNNWVGGAAPSDGANVVILAGAPNYPIVDAALTAANSRSINSLSIDAGASMSLAGFDLEVTGSISNDGLIIATGGEAVTVGVFDDTRGTVRYTGSLGVTPLPFGNSYFNLELGTGAVGNHVLQANLSVNGDLTLAANYTLTDVTANDLTVTGAFLVSGNFFPAGGASTISGTTTNNGTIQNDTGLLTFAGPYGGTGTLDFAGTGDMVFQSDVDFTGGTVAGVDSADLFLFSGGGAQQLTSALNTLPPLQVNSTGGTVTNVGNLTLVAGADLTLTDGIFDLGGATAVVPGDVVFGAAGELLDSAGQIDLDGNWNNAAGGTYTATGTVRFLDDVSATSVISGDTSFFNFVVPNPTVQPKVMQFAGGSTQTILAGGSFDVQGTAADGVTLESVTPGTQWILDVSAAATKTVAYATISDSDLLGADPAGSITPTDSVNAGGNDVYNAAGALPDDPGNDGANWVFVYVWDNGGVGTDWGTAANWDPDAVPGVGDTAIIPQVGGPFTVTLAAPRTVENLTIETTAILQTNGNALTVNNAFSNDGTLRLQGDEVLTLTPDTNSGTVEYSGAGTYANALPYGTTYWDVVFTGPGTWNPGAAQTITANNNLTFGDGDGDTVTFGDNLTATAAGAMTLNDNLAATGTATLDLSGSPVSVASDSIVGGTSTGLISLGNATLASGVTLTVGNGAATPASLGAVSGTAGLPVSNITFNTTATATVAGNMGTDLGTITVSTGTLRFAGGGAQTIAATTVVNNALIQARGDETVTLNGNSPPLAADFDTDSGTVEYYNLVAGGTPPFGSTYYNLLISQSVTVGVALDVNNNLTIGVAGILDTSGNDLTIGGSYDNSAGGQYLSGTNTTLFDHATAATVTITTGGTAVSQDFYNLQFNDGGGGATYQLAVNNLNALGNLTVTSGTFDMNGFTATVGSGAGTGNVTLLAAGTIDDGGGTLNVNGNWDNSAGGTYTTTGTTRFLDGVATSTISGNTTFNNFVVPNPTVATQTLRFAAGSTQTISAGGSFNVQGTALNAVVIESTVSGTQWTLDVNAAGVTKTVDYVTVADSDLLGADPAGSITTTNSTNGAWNDTNNADGVTAADPGNDGAYWILPPLTFTWTGGTNNWDSQTNWDIGDGTPGDDGIPSPEDNAIIPDLANDPVKTAASGPVAVTDLTLNDNASLTMEGNDLSVAGTYSSGTVATAGGTLRLVGSEAVSLGVSDTDSGTVEYYGSGTYNTALPYGTTYYDVLFTGGSTWNPPGAQAISSNGTTTFGNNDGQTVTFGNDLTVTAAGGAVLNDNLAATGTAVIDLSPSTVQVATTATVGGTSTGDIDFGAVTLADGVTLTVGTGVANAINFTTVSGTAGVPVSNLTLNTTGVVTATGAVGTDLGAVTITNSGGTTFQAALTAASAVLTNTTGTIAFQGNLNLTTGLTTANQGYNVSILGASNDIAGDTSFLNTGNVTIGNAGTDDTTFAGGLATTGNGSNPGSVNLAGQVRTIGTQMDLGAVTLDANTTLDTGAAATSIMNVGAVTSGGFALTLDSGANAAADITVASFDGGGNITITDSGGATFTGIVTAGTFTITASTDPVVFGGATTLSGNLIIAVGVTVTLSGGGGQTFEAAAVSNDGVIRARGDEVVTLGGVSPPGPGDFDSNSGNVVYYEDAPGGLPFGNEYYILQIGDGVGTDVMQLAAPVDVNSNLTIAAGGTLDASAGPHDVTVGGNWDNSAGGTYTSGANITLFDYAVAAGTATIATGGTAAGQDFGTVVFSDGGAGSVYQLLGNGIRTQSALWVANGTLDLNAQNAQVAGNWTVAAGAVFASNGGTVTFDASAANQTINPGGVDANHDFENVVFASSGGFQSALAGPILINGNLTINAGAALDASAGPHNLTIGGNYANAGSYTSGANLTTFAGTNGAGPFTLDTGGAGGTQDFQDIAFDSPTDDRVFQLINNPLDADGTLTIGVGDTLDIQGLNLTVGTAFQNLGRLLREGSGETAPRDNDSGTVEYDGAAGTIQDYGDAVPDYFALVVSNNQSSDAGALLETASSLDVATGTLTLANDLTVGTDLVISGGVLSAGANTITVVGNWDNQVGNPGFVAGTSTVEFTAPATSTITISGSTTFYNFLRGTGDIIIQFGAGDTFSIAPGGNFTATGTGPVDIETRDPTTYASPPWEGDIILTSDAPPVRWILDPDPASSISITYVFVDYSDATIPIVVPPNNLIGIETSNWLSDLPVTSSNTEDSDANGRIDQIRVVLPANHNGNDTDFQVSVTGYDVIGFDMISPPADEFLILLREKTYLDTDATPSWIITNNTSLFDSLTGTRLVVIPAPPEVPADLAPPIIAHTLTYPGSMQLFVTFSEPVYQASATSTPLASGDFGLPGPAAVSLTPVTTDGSGGIEEVLVNLSAPIGIGDILPPDLLTMAAGEDTAATPNALLDNTVSISSVAIAPESAPIVVPVLAEDETLRDPAAGGLGLIRVFDGSLFLAPELITIQAFRDAAVGVPTLVGDSDVSPTVTGNGFWLPFELPGLTLGANTGAFDFGGVDLVPGGNLSEHTLPDSNPRIRNGAVFDFFFDTGGSVEVTGGTENQYVARLATELSTPWYRNVRPFSFDIRELVTQRGGVTIANNVINPERGERATLNYTLESSEMVRIMVFNLSGDVIEILQSGRQDAGEYSTAWDGTNRQGRPVARGIYFVRVMAGETDEYRKVMVVKD